MVAILAEPQINSDPDLEIKNNEVPYRMEAIRNGHENWFIGQLDQGTQFGLVRDLSHHFGMIDFDTMNWLADELNNPEDVVWLSDEYKRDKDITKPIIGDLGTFRNYLTERFANNSAKFADRHPQPAIAVKMGIYKDNFMQVVMGDRLSPEENPGASAKELDEWLKLLVFGKKPFYKNNDNWSRVADEIKEKLPEGNEISELEKYKETIARFSKLTNFKEVSDFFYIDPIGKEFFTLLEDIHGGWRNFTYMQLGGTDVKRDYTNNLEARFRGIISSLKGLILGTLRTMNTPADKVSEVVTNAISGYRSTAQADPELDSVFTFTLIGRIGALLEDLIQNEPLPKEVINALVKSRDALLHDLKQDANVAPFDALLDYYKNEN